MNFWLALINLEENFPIGSKIKTKVPLITIANPDVTPEGTVGEILSYATKLLRPFVVMGFYYTTI